MLARQVCEEPKISITGKRQRLVPFGSIGKSNRGITTNTVKSGKEASEKAKQ